ncbi:MAG: hypothetical protein DRO12_03765 [Thermoprotei archaeon]|nr:MAG: hypothetical protein DRO12_03765 [Thermoprotei archaeon]
MIVWVWLVASVLLVTVSVIWMACVPALHKTLEALNNTMAPELSGTPLATFNLVQTVSKYALGFWVIITVGAILLWAYMKAQEKETVYGRYEA